MAMDRDEARRVLISLEAASERRGAAEDKPLEVPPLVAAQWQSAIAREAQRRVLGLPPDPALDDLFGA